MNRFCRLCTTFNQDPQHCHNLLTIFSLSVFLEYNSFLSPATLDMNQIRESNHAPQLVFLKFALVHKHTL
jgi:hypothetical protein